MLFISLLISCFCVIKKVVPTVLNTVYLYIQYVVLVAFTIMQCAAECECWLTAERKTVDTSMSLSLRYITTTE